MKKLHLMLGLVLLPSPALGQRSTAANDTLFVLRPALQGLANLGYEVRHTNKSPAGSDAGMPIVMMPIDGRAAGHIIRTRPIRIVIHNDTFAEVEVEVTRRDLDCSYPTGIFLKKREGGWISFRVFERNIRCHS